MRDRRRDWSKIHGGDAPQYHLGALGGGKDIILDPQRESLARRRTPTYFGKEKCTGVTKNWDWGKNPPIYLDIPGAEFFSHTPASAPPLFLERIEIYMKQGRNGEDATAAVTTMSKYR